MQHIPEEHFRQHAFRTRMMWWFALAIIGYVAYLAWDWLRRRPRVADVTKKCVFITGCDSGFGRALAVRLDSIGVPVFAGCLTGKGADALKAATSERLQTVIVDVTEPDSVHRAYGVVRDNLLDACNLWGIVNNAGLGGVGGPIEFISRKEFHDIMAVNFLGATEVTSTFLPLLKKSKGRIVNTSSVAGFMPFPFAPPYVSSKFAMLGYTDALRLEKRQWGIDVSCVEPGLFKTHLFNHYSEKKTQQWEALPVEIREEYGQKYIEETISSFNALVEKAASPNVSPVIDAYEHALFSRKPRAHYLPGWDAKVMAVMHAMPSYVNEAFIGLLARGPTPAALE